MAEILYHIMRLIASGYQPNPGCFQLLSAKWALKFDFHYPLRHQVFRQLEYRGLPCHASTHRSLQCGQSLAS